MYLQAGAALLQLFYCLPFCCSGKGLRVGSETDNLGLPNTRVFQADILKCEDIFFSLALGLSANYFALQSRGHDSPWRVAAHLLAFVCTEPSSVVMTPGPCIVRTLGLGRLDWLNITFFLKRCTVRDPQADCSSGLAWPQNI